MIVQTGMKKGFGALGDWNAVALISEPQQATAEAQAAATWRAVHVPDPGKNEPNELQCAELPSGEILLNVRSGNHPMRALSSSTDAGTQHCCPVPCSSAQHQSWWLIGCSRLIGRWRRVYRRDMDGAGALARARHAGHLPRQHDRRTHTSIICGSHSSKSADSIDIVAHRSAAPCSTLTGSARRLHGRTSPAASSAEPTDGLWRAPRLARRGFPGARSTRTSLGVSAAAPLASSSKPPIERAWVHRLRADPDLEQRHDRDSWCRVGGCGRAPLDRSDRLQTWPVIGAGALARSTQSCDCVCAQARVKRCLFRTPSAFTRRRRRS